MSNYEKFQMERYGNILPDVHNTPDDELEESGLAELDRIAEWMDAMAEKDLQR